MWIIIKIKWFDKYCQLFNLFDIKRTTVIDVSFNHNFKIIRTMEL